MGTQEHPKTKILLGVCGGIASYKTPDLVRLLKKSDYEVRVILTEAGKSFVTELSLQVVSGHRVATSLLDCEQENQIGHIELADWADILLIAPATADAIAKMAHGLCPDLLSTVYLATKAKILLAPSMNVNMWQHPATQNNINNLKIRGAHVLEPEEGDLACGWTGKGRLPQLEQIVHFINQFK